VRHRQAQIEAPCVKEPWARSIIHLEFVSFRSMETKNPKAVGSKTERSSSQQSIEAI
jgi:hypothetical protein